jgi:hypothetical protein
MGFLAGILYVLLSIVIGLLLVGLSMHLVEIEPLCQYLSSFFYSDLNLTSPRMTVLLIGIVLLLCVLRYMQTGLRRSRQSKAIRFESSHGTVSITLFAIEDMLKKMFESRPEVSHIRPKVSLRKKGLDILIRGVLNVEVNLVDFTQTVQDKIKEKMETFLGEDKDIRVNLEIRKVSTARDKDHGPNDEPEVPFRHYD